MINAIFKKVFFACLLFTPFNPANAQNFLDLAGLSPDAHYKTFDTEHFHFIYQDGYFEFTARAAAHFEHANEVLGPILKWKPHGKTDILIADNDDDANGFTMPVLRVGIVLIATPPDQYFSTSYADDWIKLLVWHEYTHFLNIDPTTEWMNALRLFFGDIIRPNGLWPVWMLEGLAVYYETRTSTLGRGRSPYYDGILRAYFNEGKLGTSHSDAITFERVNADDPYFPGGEVPYLFGYHLWNQFSKDHSLFQDTDSQMGEYSLRSSHRVPFFLDGNLENVMKKEWDDYWSSFVSESNERLSKQVEAVKKEGETPHTFLTRSKYASNLGAISPNGEWMAYTQSSTDDRSRLVLLNLTNRRTLKLDEKVLGVGMGFTPDSRYLIYSSLRKHKSYYLYSDLFSFDLVTKQIKQLTHGLRAKDPGVSPDGQNIVFIQSEAGTHLLKTAKLVVTPEGPEIKDVSLSYKPSRFSILGSPRFINANQIVFSLQEIGSARSDLMLGSLDGKAPQTLLSDGHFNRYPSPGKNGIQFTSDRNGIENIYTLSGKSTVRKTNVITAAEFPIESPKGDLYASLLTSDGFEIAKFSPAPNQVLSSKTVAISSAPAPIASALTAPTTTIDPNQVSDYSPWSSMLPRQWAPISYLTYGSDAGVSIDGTVLGFDSTGKQQYFGLFGYNFKPKTFDASFDYTLYAFRPVIDLQVNTFTTDIATDINHSMYRKSSEVALALSYPIRWTFSSLKPRIYGFTSWNKIYDLNTGARIQTSDFEYSKPMVPGIGASISFSDAETTKLGFMPEYGNDITLAAEDRINTGRFSVLKYLGSVKHYFKVGSHSVLQPTAKFLGSTHTTGIDRSFARLEGRNSSDIYDRGTNTGLNQLGLRGYTDGTFFSKQAAIGSLDFHFPLKTIFSALAGTAPLAFKQMHGFIFGESAYIPSSRLRNFFLPSFGGGISLDTILFVRAPVKFNLEAQSGTRKDYGGDTSLFVSIESGSLF